MSTTEKFRSLLSHDKNTKFKKITTTRQSAHQYVSAASANLWLLSTPYALITWPVCPLAQYNNHIQALQH